MQTVRRLAALWLLVLWLPACSLFIPRPPAVMPVADATLAGQRHSYLLSWQTDNHTRQMLLVLEQHDNSVQLVGLSNTGITLFTLQRSAQGEQLETSYFYKDGPQPAQLLNQLLLVYYPVSLLQQQLGSDWQIQQNDSGRQWFYRGRLLGTAIVSVSDGQQQIQIKDTDQPLHLQPLATEQY